MSMEEVGAKAPNIQEEEIKPEQGWRAKHWEVEFYRECKAAFPDGNLNAIRLSGDGAGEQSVLAIHRKELEKRAIKAGLLSSGHLSLTTLLEALAPRIINGEIDDDIRRADEQAINLMHGK